MDQSHQIPVRAHARNKSIPKPTRPRSTTKGPLDVDDISLNSPKPSDVATTFLSPDPGPLTGGGLRPTSPHVLSPRNPRSPARSPGPGLSPRLPPQPTKKDFSFLLRPEIYHTLSPQAVPPAFRNSPLQPAPDTSIPELLARGHFRAAAVAAVQQLTGTAGHDPPAPDDHARIFSLLHTRLACLTLIDATPIAAQEVKALEDVQSPFYLAQPAASLLGSPGLGLGIDGPGPLRSPNPSLLRAPTEEPPEHLVPWELRILAVRLQSLGFGDPRRSVMSYYELAREARARLARASAIHDNSARELHKERLAELGIKVAGALIEMDDLAGAAAHLKTLVDHGGGGGGGKLATARALLWLHLGDIDAARSCLDNQMRGDSTQDKVISALCDMADGEYDAALATWSELREELPNDEMVGVNMATCLLYVGRMSQGRQILESMVDSGFGSHTLLFNLTTMYELCTDKARSLKQRLVERAAEMEPNPKGWEKTNADFKL